MSDAPSFKKPVCPSCKIRESIAGYLRSARWAEAGQRRRSRKRVLIPDRSWLRLRTTAHPWTVWRPRCLRCCQNIAVGAQEVLRRAAVINTESWIVFRRMQAILLSEQPSDAISRRFRILQQLELHLLWAPLTPAPCKTAVH